MSGTKMSVTKRSWWQWIPGMRLVPFYGKHMPMVTSPSHYIFDTKPETHGDWDHPDAISVFGYAATSLTEGGYSSKESREPDLSHPLTKGALVGILRELTGDPYACVYLHRGMDARHFPEWKWVAQWATGSAEISVDFSDNKRDYEAEVLILALDKVSA